MKGSPKMMEDEQILIVDEFDTPIGIGDRETAVESSKWRRACGGLIVDQFERAVLCHQRSSNKDERGGLWVATFGGKARESESPEQTAYRELSEEFGLGEEVLSLAFFGRYKSHLRFQWEYVYTASVVSSVKVIIDPLEVEAFSWVPLATVVRCLKTDASWFCYGYESAVLAHLLDLNGDLSS